MWHNFTSLVRQSTHLVRSLRVFCAHAEVLARLRMRVELRILDPEAGLAFSLKLWDGEKW